MRKFYLALVISLFTLQPVNAAPVDVTVTGEGISKESALKDALRKALEQGGKLEISSHSKVENFELIRDTIYARADGIVKGYKVLSEKEGLGGIWKVQIRATVDPDAIASTWGEVQNILDQIGRPGIVVMITEKIDGEIQDTSILETEIEKHLHTIGFDVFAGKQVREIAAREAADADMEGNTRKIQAIAKEFDAQILIVGEANADAAGVKDIYGEKIAFYNGDCRLKVFYADTGKLLASESELDWRSGSRGMYAHSPQAARKALAKAAESLMANLYQDVMQTWSTQISAGGHIRIEVEGLTVADAIKIKKALRKIDKIEKVHYEYTKGLATYRLVGKITAEELSEILVEPEWEDKIELLDIKLNRIQAKKPD